MQPQEKILAEAIEKTLVLHFCHDSIVFFPASLESYFKLTALMVVADHA
jgi:hypothetical protein